MRTAYLFKFSYPSVIFILAFYFTHFGVGEETVGYVTKGVIALSLYLMLFALEAAKMCKIIGQNEYDTWVSDVNALMLSA